MTTDTSESTTDGTNASDQAQISFLDRFWANLFAGSAFPEGNTRRSSVQGHEGSGEMTISSWIVDRSVEVWLTWFSPPREGTDRSVFVLPVFDSLSGLFKTTSAFLYDQLSPALPVGRQDLSDHEPTGLAPRVKRGDLSESVLGSIPLTTTTTTANDTHTISDRGPILAARSDEADTGGSGWGVWYFSDEGVSRRVWTGSMQGSEAAVKPFDEVVEGIRR